MNKELYDDMSKALSKGYADRCDQLNALDLIEELQAEVARLRESLGEFARFASKDGLGASVPFGQSKLHKARAALEHKD
jgi:hypothetical protein